MSQNDKRRRYGQSTMEFATFICIVVAALMAMRYYGFRAFQGRLRSNTQELSSMVYSPRGVTGVTNTTKSVTESSITNSTDEGNDVTNTTSTILINRTQSFTQTEDIVGLDSDPGG